MADRLRARGQFRTYDELTGASGKRVFFRPERHRAGDLFARGAPTAFVSQRPYALVDISRSGLSVLRETESDGDLSVGAIMPLEIRYADMMLYRGDVRVVRIEPTLRGHKVALQFVNDYPDLTSFDSRYREAVLREKLGELPDQKLGDLEREYKLLCADTVSLLRAYRRLLDQDTGPVPDENIQTRILDLCMDAIWPQWNKLCERGNMLTELVLADPVRHAAMKRLTLDVLTPEFMTAPCWRHAYEKPLGYPGDYQLLDFVYDPRYLGETPYAKLVHRVGVRGSMFVAARMEAMMAVLRDVCEGTGRTDLCRIMNLGCGSAAEVAGYLATRVPGRPVEFTLIDQDERALDVAYGRAYPHLLKSAGAIKVRCLQTSFAQLIKGGELAGNLPPQNLIYTVGLTDYLSERRARLLVEGLYETLAPGGELVIANLRRCPGSGHWFAEMILDWSMVFRTEAEMLALARNLTPATLKLTTDATDKVYFLKLQKPR